MAWLTPDELTASWPDAPKDTARLERILDAAQEECEAYAPALADPAVVPARYKEALLLQCQEVWGAAKRNGDVLGSEDYPIRVRPLADVVRQRLRPRSPRPRFGRRPVTP